MAYLTGLKNVEDNLNDAINQIKGDVAEGVQDVGLDLLSESVKLAPVKTGTLRGSGYVEFNGIQIAEGTTSGGIIANPLAPGSVDNPSAEIGFGEEYSVTQHETLEYEHPKGGQAKYLEEPMKDNTMKYIDLIRKKAKVD